MTRSLFAVFALGAIAVSVGLIDACNNPACGAGTKQRTRSDGTLVCEPVDQPAPLAQCDNGDGGSSVILEGKCVSRVRCDPSTTMVGFLADGTEVCVGTGGGGCGCSTPDATHICVFGNLYDFAGGVAGTKHGMVTDPITVGAFDPLQFLADPKGTPPLGTDNSNPGTAGCYVIKDVTPPQTMLLAIGVQDAANVPDANKKFMITGVGIAQVTGGKIYQRDAYMITKAQAQMWSTQAGGGTDFVTNGMMIAQFFDTTPPDPTKIVYDAMGLKGVGGVKFTQGNTTEVPGTKYAMPRDVIVPSLTATAPNVGVAMAPTMGLGNYNGTGGMCMGGQACKWQVNQAASVAGVVFIQDYFACNYNPTAFGCM